MLIAIYSIQLVKLYKLNGASAAFIKSVPASDTFFVTRIDRNGGAFGSELSQSISSILNEEQFSLSGISNASIAIKNALHPSSAFEFMFNCDASESKCDLVKAGFVSASSRIAQVLQITSPIIVDVKFHSFCQAQGGGSCSQANNTIGRASSAAYFSAEDINFTKGQSPAVYYYPQSLVKQLSNDRLNFAPVDIYAEFNADFNFYFKSSGNPIGANQTDFEFTICHELTHGLGFESNWVQYSSYYYSFSPPSDILSPLPFAQGPTYASAIISAISPLTIFDSLLQVPSSSEPLSAFGSVIINFKAKGLSLSEFFGDLRNDANLNTAAKNAMSAARSGLQAKSLANSIDLHTPSNYVQGTSIVHVAPKASTTTDFLMIPAMSPLLGKSLDEILSSVNSTFIYGPGISAIMAGIGWPTKDNPNHKPLHIIRTSDALDAPFHHIWVPLIFFLLQ